MADWYKTSLAPGSFEKATPASLEDGGVDALSFKARRSPVLCRKACVASSQPLASAAGYDILKAGGNAADAAIAVAATLAVVEPCSTGLGGDMFALWYQNSTKQVSCINGSGHSPESLTREKIQAKYPAANTPNGIDAALFRDSPLAVTVPGAAQGWQDLYDKHASGKFTFLELLQPAIDFAEEGFPVTPITSYHWRAGMSQISKWLSADQEIPFTTAEGTAPLPGDIFTNPAMARVLRDLGESGATEGFYKGRTGQAIVEVVAKHGGCLTQQDLNQHTSDFPQPIAAEYRNCKLWQVPPNGQGIAGLIALTGLAQLEEKGIVPPDVMETPTVDSYHVMMEMMRLAFADIKAHVADANHMKVTNEWLLDPERIGSRAEKLYQPQKAAIQGIPDVSSCTVSFQVVDVEGNAISFVNSNFMGFGTGIVPDDCGFSLQNRGFGFSLEEGHANQIGPSKRPFHTIIPGLLTYADTNELYATISNMGGNMQPQGHFQLTVGMLAQDLDPQMVIDRPRFCIVDGSQQGKIYLEEGVDEKVVKALKRRGHLLEANIHGQERSIFGRAQIIKRDRRTGVLWAGSDGRADGCAMGF